VEQWPTYCSDESIVRVDMCAICGSCGDWQHILCCGDCGDVYHSFCLNSTNVEVNLERRDTTWRCNNCMLCHECGKADNSAKMLVCDTCDSAHHMYCLTPPLKSMPDAFRCDKCVVCRNCGTRAPGPNEGDEWTYNYTLCQACGKRYDDNEFCNVCDRVTSSDDIIKCEHCSQHVHIACDLTAIQSSRISSVRYACPTCRSPGNSSSNTTVSRLTRTTAAAMAQRLAEAGEDDGDTDVDRLLVKVPVMKTSQVNHRGGRDDYDGSEALNNVHMIPWSQFSLERSIFATRTWAQAGVGLLPPPITSSNTTNALTVVNATRAFTLPDESSTLSLPELFERMKNMVARIQLRRRRARRRLLLDAHRIKRNIQPIHTPYPRSQQILNQRALLLSATQEQSALTSSSSLSSQSSDNKDAITTVAPSLSSMPPITEAESSSSLVSSVSASAMDTTNDASSTPTVVVNSSPIPSDPTQPSTTTTASVSLDASSTTSTALPPAIKYRAGFVEFADSKLSSSESSISLLSSCHHFAPAERKSLTEGAPVAPVVPPQGSSSHEPPSLEPSIITKKEEPSPSSSSSTSSSFSLASSQSLIAPSLSTTMPASTSSFTPSLTQTGDEEETNDDMDQSALQYARLIQSEMTARQMRIKRQTRDLAGAGMDRTILTITEMEGDDDEEGLPIECIRRTPIILPHNDNTTSPVDTRRCQLCGKYGDQDTTELSEGRLLPADSGGSDAVRVGQRWVHALCALWSAEVHEASPGILSNVFTSIRRGMATVSNSLYNCGTHFYSPVTFSN
jgi:hypothetical protein